LARSEHLLRGGCALRQRRGLVRNAGGRPERWLALRWRLALRWLALRWRLALRWLALRRRLAVRAGARPTLWRRTDGGVGHQRTGVTAQVLPGLTRVLTGLCRVRARRLLGEGGRPTMVAGRADLVRWRGPVLAIGRRRGIPASGSPLWR
jgi:hypothetical protein